MCDFSTNYFEIWGLKVKMIFFLIKHLFYFKELKYYFMKYKSSFALDLELETT